MKITAAVILVSFLNCPMFGEAPTVTLNDSGNGGMRFYSDSEVREIVGELSEAAEEAIEGAAAEAAKTAALASLEREGAARREAAAAVAEARHWQEEYRTAQGRGIKNVVIAGVVCFLGGIAIGAIGIIGMRSEKL
ncbi:ABC transporter permease [Treponema primitia]|uniref:ABC transporter permease n=1 Tax=Treponema primitia TaxID=88058 RepID=UPI00397F4AE1